MLMPDHVYPVGYFTRLANLTADHPVILQAGMSAYALNAAKPLEKYRNKEGFLLVPAEDLAEIGWRYRHKQSDAHMLKPTEEFPSKWPRSHMVMWQGKDSVQLSCPHLNPIWLSPAICAAARLLPPSTIDAELPQLIKDAEFYMAQPEDGLSFVELSNEKKGAPLRDVPFSEFARAWWTQVNFRSPYLRFANVLSHVPIRTGPKNGLSDVRIEEQHQEMMAKLIDIKAEKSLLLDPREKLRSIRHCSWVSECMMDDDLQQPDDQRQLTPTGTYSYAADLARKVLQAKGSPQQYKAALTKQGVKPDEFKYSNYDQAFAGKPMVTRDQLAQHFQQSLPKVQETTLDTKKDPGFATDVPGVAKFSQYQLPGGTNYRETLLHLPAQPAHAAHSLMKAARTGRPEDLAAM